jgi:hypothetical protein
MLALNERTLRARFYSAENSTRFTPKVIFTPNTEAG